MYIKVNGYVDTVKITYYKYSLFKKRKIYKTKEVNSYGHWYTIIRDTDNIDNVVNRWKQCEEKQILNDCKRFCKRWHDVKVEATIGTCKEKISDLSVEQAMKLLTLQQFKEEFGCLITLEKQGLF